MARCVPLLFFAVLLAGLQLGSCIHCYQCNSQNDPNCKDPFRATRAAIDCSLQDTYNFNRIFLQPAFPSFSETSGAPRYCHKIVMSSGTVMRTCLDANPTEPTHTCGLLKAAARNNPIPGAEIKECTVCTTDGCNGAASIVASLPLALITVIVSYLYCKQ